MTSPRFSWLIPVRDAGATLAQAIGSIANQTLQDWEAIVVDDGSRDVVVSDVVRSVVGADARFHVVRTARKGIVSALNEGLAICRADWVARLDADDVAIPDRLERQQALIAEGIAVIDGKISLFTDFGDPPEGMRKWADWLNSLGENGWFAERLVDVPVCHPAVLMRRQAVESVGGYRDGDFPEDFDLWLRLIGQGWRFARVPDDPVVEVRDRPDRLTRSDPRYRRAAFDEVRRQHLEQTVLSAAENVVVWGAGKTGRRWIRWLRNKGCKLSVVDPFQVGKLCQDHSVLGAQALCQLPVDLLLVAVAARGAREEIRADIQRLRPDLVEGTDWLFVA